MDHLNLIEFDEVALNHAAQLAFNAADDDDEIILVDDDVEVQQHHHQQSADDEHLVPSASSSACVESTETTLPPIASILPPRTATSDLPPPQVSTGNGADEVGQRFNGRAALGLGASQIFVGMACIMLGISSVVIRINLYYVFHGFWAGMMCVTSGVVGVCASRVKTSRRIALFMTMSILSSACTIAMFSVSIYASIDMDLLGRQSQPCSPPRYSGCNTNMAIMNASLAINLIEAVLSMVALTLCLTSTALAAKASCNRSFCLCDCCFQPAVRTDQGFCLQYTRSREQSELGLDGNFRFYERPPPYTPAEPPPSYTPTSGHEHNKERSAVSDSAARV